MGMTVMVVDRERIISLLKEMSDYFRECRSNASLGSNAENHFWELQVAAHDAATTLEEQKAVVRCKDCKHATMTANGKMCKYCEIDTDDFGYQRVVYHDADWFCADGKRREEK